MRTPSNTALIILAAVFLFGMSVSVPEPKLIPVTGLDGSLAHRADGSVLAYQDVAKWNKDLIPLEIFCTCFFVCIIWLLIRFISFLYARWRYRKHVS